MAGCSIKWTRERLDGRGRSMTSFCGLKVHAKVMYGVCSPCTVVEVTLVSLSSQPHTVINSYSIQDSSHRMVHVNSKIVSDLLATLAWLGHWVHTGNTFQSIILGQYRCSSSPCRYRGAGWIPRYCPRTRAGTCTYMTVDLRSE